MKDLLYSGCQLLLNLDNITERVHDDNTGGFSFIQPPSLLTPLYSSDVDACPTGNTSLNMDVVITFKAESKFFMNASRYDNNQSFSAVYLAPGYLPYVELNITVLFKMIVVFEEGIPDYVEYLNYNATIVDTATNVSFSVSFELFPDYSWRFKSRLVPLELFATQDYNGFYKSTFIQTRLVLYQHLTLKRFFFVQYLVTTAMIPITIATAMAMAMDIMQTWVSVTTQQHGLFLLSIPG